jgi:UDP-glucose 4-epimerase
MLSKDKAVMSINAMGISKAMMEKLTYGFKQNAHINKIFSVTRYGNVIGSRGSVVPIL